MGSRLRVTAFLFLALAVLFAGLPLAEAQNPITVAVGKTDGSNFPSVTAYVTLIEASGRPVLGLGPDGWELTEDGKRVNEVQVGTAVNDQEPLQVVLVIDTSGSMRGKPIEDAKAAATTFVQGLAANDRAAIVAFADKPSVAQSFTGSRDDLVRSIGGLKAEGETALHDALLLAAQTVGQQKTGRRIVVLLTDGTDTVSKASLTDALSGVQMVGAPVFTVGLGANVDRTVLGNLAVATGGVALYAPSSADLRTAFDNIAQQLRNQYVLTFKSSLPADDGRHALVVRAKVGEAQAEAKAAFVATSTPPEITILSPQPDQVVSGKARIEVQVKAAGTVRKIEATAAGRVVGTVEAEPYVLEWDTSQLAGGNHLLDVTVVDSLGNRGTKQVAVRVEAKPIPTPLPTATIPAPTPTPTPAGTAFDSNQLVVGWMGLFAFLSLALLLVRRSRRQRMPSAWKRMPKDKPVAKCPECGRDLKRGQECPDCAVKDEELIRQRLRDLGEGGNGVSEGGEDRR